MVCLSRGLKPLVFPAGIRLSSASARVLKIVSCCRRHRGALLLSEIKVCEVISPPHACAHVCTPSLPRLMLLRAASFLYRQCVEGFPSSRAQYRIIGTSRATPEPHCSQQSTRASRDSAGLQSTAGQRWIPVTVGYGKIVINFSRGGRLSRSPFQHGAAAGIVLRQVQELGPPGIRRVCAQRKCTRVRGSAGCFIQRSPGGWRWSLISACEACTWVLRPLRG